MTYHHQRRPKRARRSSEKKMRAKAFDRVVTVRGVRCTGAAAGVALAPAGACDVGDWIAFSPRFFVLRDAVESKRSKTRAASGTMTHATPNHVRRRRTDGASQAIPGQRQA